MSGDDATLRLGLVGARGHMGRRVLALLEAAAGPWPAAQGRSLRLAATLQRQPSALGTPHLGPSSTQVDGPGVLHAYDAAAFAAVVDVVVDFSAPAAAEALAPHLARHNVAYVVASTGLAPSAQQALDAAASVVPVLVAANTSLGVWVLAEAVRQTAALWPSADVEVAELHHRRKRDAPSGTALMLGAAVRDGWRVAEGEAAAGERGEVRGRGPAQPPRKAGELGYSAVRGGDVVGEHTVYLLGDGERLELTHRCTNADTFACGALQAAAWLAGRGPGAYTFADVLGRRGP